jgi:hypothetical protein
MTGEFTMTEEPLCLRCGGSRLIHAHLEHPLAFCLDHMTHHGVVAVGMKAAICEDCGHVEFLARDPSRIVGYQEAHKDSLQEEDF